MLDTTQPTFIIDTSFHAYVINTNTCLHFLCQNDIGQHSLTERSVWINNRVTFKIKARITDSIKPHYNTLSIIYYIRIFTSNFRYVVVPGYYW